MKWSPTTEPSPLIIMLSCCWLRRGSSAAEANKIFSTPNCILGSPCQDFWGLFTRMSDIFQWAHWHWILISILGRVIPKTLLKFKQAAVSYCLDSIRIDSCVSQQIIKYVIIVVCHSIDRLNG